MGPCTLGPKKARNEVWMVGSPWVGDPRGQMAKLHPSGAHTVGWSSRHIPFLPVTLWGFSSRWFNAYSGVNAFL